MPRVNAPKLIQAIGGKSLVIPAEGWNAHNFAVHGKAMIVALSRVARLTQRRATPTLAMAALGVFKGQLREIIGLATRKHVKAIENATGQHGALWDQAIDDVMGAGAAKEMASAIMPPIQSVMAQGVSKTAILLGLDPEDVSKNVTRQSRKIAERITKISDTTRKKIVRIVTNSIENGDSIVETANKLEAAGNEIFSSRAMTIARTELSNAWAIGAADTFKTSETITHLSVIGCEKRETDNQWQYKGQSTCNFPDLPITELDAFMEISFHPNHTGTIVPSGFRNPDGSAPD